ncbi:thiosulfate:glutathione sulfurtransferase [Brachyhypopomus gauderio]|uniref:thiosulfate:glutathione sulfurtransferase n=1 Tax=Brachyhypopomus gauderio TaxID=698409 RepID=UPI0040432CD8
MRLRLTTCVWGAVIAVMVVVAKQCEEVCDNEPDGPCKQDPRAVYSEAIHSDTVSYEQLKEMMATGILQLFDVRNPDEFEEGYIPGATNIPLDDLEDAFRMDPDQFRQHYGVSMPGKSDCDFILHCQRGRRSLTALEIVQHLGYFRARHYAGGYSEWAQLEAQ